MTTLAQLQARADGNQFFLVVTPNTILLRGDHVSQGRVVATPTSPRVAVTWTAQFRGKQQHGLTLVADAGMSAYAQQLVLDEANNELNVLDARLNTLNKPPGPDLTG